MATHLFLASTPFNVLTSAMMAFELPDGDDAYLGLIDQPITERPFIRVIKKWVGSPFKETLSLSQQIKGKGKLKQRKQSLKAVGQLIDDINPSYIYTGNDRRIEFQYAMHHSASAQGCYLDDGTYSYLGRKTHWLKDKVIDNLIKKLTYGLWWKQPLTIGASAWINQAILAFPESAVPELKSKKCTLLPQNLDRPEFQQLAKQSLQQIGYPATALLNIKALLLLPHNSVMNHQIKQKMSYWLTEQTGSIAFKHHPRTKLTDVTGDKDIWSIPGKAQQVPAGIPMEVLLPLLDSNCLIAGDVSTALLTAKWLRPELDVTAFAAPDTQSQWLNLLTNLNINIKTAD